MLQTRRGSNPQPPDHQSAANPTEPQGKELKQGLVKDLSEMKNLDKLYI